MRRNDPVLVRHFSSLAGAEEWLARCWRCLVENNLQTPAVSVEIGFGATVTVRFDDSRAAERVVECLDAG